MRSLWWVLTQYDCCPYFFLKKKEFGHRNRHAQREKDVKTYREKTVMWLDWCIFKPKDAGSHQKPEGRSWTTPSLSTREHGTAKPWFLTASLQNCDNTFLLFKFLYFVGVLGGREVGFIARHAWVRRGQLKALMSTGPAICPENHDWGCF